jgi:hypothetical protein
MRGLDPRIYDAFAAIDGLTNAAGAARHHGLPGSSPAMTVERVRDFKF